MDAAELGRELSTAVVAFHEALGSHLGVGAVDQRAHALIRSLGPVSAGELAHRIGLTPGAVTAMINRLERAGLARREPDPADGRRVLISAVGEGAKDLAVFPALNAAMAELAASYSPAEQRAIADWVGRTIEILQEQTRRLSAAAD